MGPSDSFSGPRSRMLSTRSCRTHLHPKYDTNDHEKDARWPTSLGPVASILLPFIRLGSSWSSLQLQVDAEHCLTGTSATLQSFTMSLNSLRL